MKIDCIIGIDPGAAGGIVVNCMADETKAPQIENPEKITVREFAEMVKQMRHNQRRCQRNPTPEKLATLESWERRVDAVVAVVTDTQLKLW